MGKVVFRGSFVALATPFDKNFRVDVRKLQEIVRWQIEEGTDGIVCSGTTGEAPTLTPRDRARALQACLEVAEKKIPVVAGTGTCDTRQTIQLTEQAQRLGADGCLVVVPYYNKPTQRGCFRHFEEVSKVGLPVIAYDNPGRAVVALQPETIGAIGKLASVAAIKASVSDPAFLRKIRAASDLPILAGEDALAVAMIQEGAQGCIAVVANMIPRAWKRMIELALQGEFCAAKRLSDRYQGLCRAMFLETNPQCVKYALELFGKCSSRLRLPLVEPEEGTKRSILSEIIRLSLPCGGQISAPAKR